MFKNYFKIAVRNLRKNRIDSVISIAGLAVGIACCLLLVAFVRFEWSFDDFHKNSDRIYMVYSTYTNPNTAKESNSSITPYPLASALDVNIPGINKAVRFRSSAADVNINGEFITERKVNFAEPDFLTIFSFPLLAGNVETALDKPNSILLTRNKAEQIFGTTQVLGKILTLRNEGKKVPFIITGVLKNIPDNSSFMFNYLLPFENSLLSLSKIEKESWFIGGSETYVMLNKNVDPLQVGENIERNLGNGVPKQYLNRTTTHFLPLDRMYLTPKISLPYKRSSNPLYAWILACIALVVLGIAAINFMSLTLSRAVQRGNEISIRKVVGAGRGQLTLQFIGEALLTCTLAFLMGGALAELTTPWFSELIDKPVSLGLLNNPAVWSMMAGLLLLTTLITGGYPAWVLTRTKTPTRFISHTTSSKVPVVVKGLIVMQFTLAIAFLISSFIMVNQMEFISSKDLGFEPKNLVDIKMSLSDPEQGGKIFDVYSREALKIPGVKSATAIYGFFGNSSYSSSLVTDSLRTGINVEIIDEDFINTMNVNLIEGRNFSSTRPSEMKTGVLLNQKAVELFGWKNPVGKKIIQTKYKTFLDGKEILGVIQNYNYRPLYYPIKPMIFLHRSVEGNPAMQMRAKIAAKSMPATLNRLKNLWSGLYTNESFTYSSVSDLIAEQYAPQRRWKSIMELASAIAILLACFGLFGLTALAARRRTKEIGIRKVLGATISNIVSLLSKDFLKLVAIGFVIAVPIAWYAMHKWLADFAYKIDIGPGIFLLAGGLALLIALATVSWQSIRAALANPVDSLRSE